jgi:hypothetical protein
MRKPGRARMPVATALRRLKTMQRYNVPQGNAKERPRAIITLPQLRCLQVPPLSHDDDRAPRQSAAKSE